MVEGGAAIVGSVFADEDGQACLFIFLHGLRVSCQAGPLSGPKFLQRYVSAVLADGQVPGERS